MIDRSEFTRAWKHLCSRFGKQDDGEQAAAYLRYLDDQISTQEFMGAARALWATAKWFPRPVDFLLVAAGDDWQAVLSAAAGFSPPGWDWTTHWDAMSPRAQEACKRLGGMDAVRKLWEKDLVKLKSEWERAYEQSAAQEIALTPLPPPVQKVLAR